MNPLQKERSYMHSLFFQLILHPILSKKCLWNKYFLQTFSNNKSLLFKKIRSSCSINKIKQLVSAWIVYNVWIYTHNNSEIFKKQYSSLQLFTIGMSYLVYQCTKHKISIKKQVKPMGLLTFVFWMCRFTPEYK